MITWGINALNHGSSLAVFSGNQLIFNESCTGDELDSAVIHRAFSYGGPSKIYWYERPWLKKIRQAYAGQWHRVFDQSAIPKNYVKKINVGYADIIYTPHHASHAAAGYYTSPFDRCAVVVLDAIGEFESATIWMANQGELKKMWSRIYPNSLGLFYSAFTHYLGMQPIVDEGKLQEMAKKGDPDRYYQHIKDYFEGIVSLKCNLHRGVVDKWLLINSDNDKHDIAAAVQRVFEEQISLVMTVAKSLTGSDSLVYMGGCAMNSAANRQVVEPKFKYLWSLPQPGDASSSVGAVLYHTKQKITNYNFGVVKHIEVRV
jgi:carbamoyltransferase